MKKIIFLNLFFFLSMISFAQEKTDSTIKVMVIEKTVKDGEDIKVIEKTMENDEAQEYLKENPIDQEMDDELELENDESSSIKKEKRVEINDAGEKIIKVKVVEKKKGEKKKVLEWEGKDIADMPMELQKYFEDDETNNMDKSDNISKSTTEVRIIETDKEQKEYKEIEVEVEEGNTNSIQHMKIGGYVGEPNKKRSKAQLGVMIGDSPKGILVTGLVEGASAELGGLMQGDIITHVDGQKVNSPQELVEKVKKYYADDVITLSFLRDSKEMSKSFILQKRSPRTWDEAIEGLK